VTPFIIPGPILPPPPSRILPFGDLQFRCVHCARPTYQQHNPDPARPGDVVLNVCEDCGRRCDSIPSQASKAPAHVRIALAQRAWENALQMN